jgi:hypothetical protein
MVLVTEHHGLMVNTPVTYLRGPGSNLGPGPLDPRFLGSHLAEGDKKIWHCFLLRGIKDVAPC